MTDVIKKKLEDLTKQQLMQMEKNRPAMTILSTAEYDKRLEKLYQEFGSQSFTEEKGFPHEVSPQKPNRSNLLTFAFNFNKSAELMLTPQHFDYLIAETLKSYNYALPPQNIYTACIRNWDAELFLSPQQFDILLEYTDINDNMTEYPLAKLILSRHNSLHLNLSAEQINKLIEKTDFSKETLTFKQLNSLALIMASDKPQKLNLSEAQKNKILYSSLLSTPPGTDMEDTTHVILSALLGVGLGAIDLTFEQLDYIFEDSKLSIAHLDTLDSPHDKIRYIYRFIGRTGAFENSETSTDPVHEYNMRATLRAYEEYRKIKMIKVEQNRLNKSIPTLLKLPTETLSHTDNEITTKFKPINKI